jgi:hypothetical protein
MLQSSEGPCPSRIQRRDPSRTAKHRTCPRPPNGALETSEGFRVSPSVPVARAPHKQARACGGEWSIGRSGPARVHPRFEGNARVQSKRKAKRRYVAPFRFRRRHRYARPSPRRGSGRHRNEDRNSKTRGCWACGSATPFGRFRRSSPARTKSVSTRPRTRGVHRATGALAPNESAGRRSHGTQWHRHDCRSPCLPQYLGRSPRRGAMRRGGVNGLLPVERCASERRRRRRRRAE